MKCSCEMLQNLKHFMHKKTNFVFFFVFHFRQLFTFSLYALVYVNIDQGIHNGKKGKKLHNMKKKQKIYVGFLIHKNQPILKHFAETFY